MPQKRHLAWNAIELLGHVLADLGLGADASADPVRLEHGVRNVLSRQVGSSPRMLKILR
jgi:hypothetical protein